MLLNSTNSTNHISAYARCIAGKVCGLLRSTWGTSKGEDKLGARDEIPPPPLAIPPPPLQFPFPWGGTVTWHKKHRKY